MLVNGTQYNSSPYFQGKLQMINLKRGKKAIVETSKEFDNELREYVRNNFLNSEGKPFGREVKFNDEQLTAFEDKFVKTCGLTMPKRPQKEYHPIIRKLDDGKYSFEIPQVYRIVHDIK